MVHKLDAVQSKTDNLLEEFNTEINTLHKSVKSNDLTPDGIGDLWGKAKETVFWKEIDKQLQEIIDERKKGLPKDSDYKNKKFEVKKKSDTEVTIFPEEKYLHSHTLEIKGNKITIKDFPNYDPPGNSKEQIDSIISFLDEVDKIERRAQYENDVLYLISKDKDIIAYKDGRFNPNKLYLKNVQNEIGVSVEDFVARMNTYLKTKGILKQ